MRRVLTSVIFWVVFASHAAADEMRADFNAIRSLERTAAPVAFTKMVELAEAGYTPATARVGYYLRHGLGTQKDLLAAKSWYERATSLGHPWSFAALARVKLDLRLPDEALRLLQSASQDARPGAERLLGSAHVDQMFDAASDPSLGMQILLKRARAGDGQAARDLLQRYNWNRLRGQAPQDIVERVAQIGLEGDARFAEAALVYLTRQNDKSVAVTEKRKALIRVPELRRKIYLTERIRLAADMRPKRFWLEVEEVLAETESAYYAQVVSTAFWISKNAWVRVLQMELKALGYYAGPIDARMTRQTIYAQNRFCRERKLSEICASGPLRGPTVRAVAHAIGGLRNHR